MALDGPTATIIAALIAATVVFVSLGWNVLYRLGKLDQGTEDMEKALDKLATATERRFERLEETIERVATATEKRFERLEETIERVATATEKRFERLEETMEKVSSDMERRFERSASDMERRFERSEETMRVEHEVTRAEIRRVVEAIASHTHDADGTTIFRIPPG
jgi:DNA anti-recombination protein RmuC